MAVVSRMNRSSHNFHCHSVSAMKMPVPATAAVLLYRYLATMAPTSKAVAPLPALPAGTAVCRPGLAIVHRSSYTFNLFTVLVTCSPSFSRKTIVPNSRCDHPSSPSVRGSEARIAPVASSSVHTSKS